MTKIKMNEELNQQTPILIVKTQWIYVMYFHVVCKQTCAKKSYYIMLIFSFLNEKKKNMTGLKGNVF